jgi:hypothetical protein
MVSRVRRATSSACRLAPVLAKIDFSCTRAVLTLMSCSSAMSSIVSPQASRTASRASAFVRPTAARGPPLLGWPSYSPLSRATESDAKLCEMRRCWTERKAPHARPVHCAGLDLRWAVLRNSPTGSHRSGPSSGMDRRGALHVWRLRQGSTLHPSASKADALSIERRGHTLELQRFSRIVHGQA